MRTTIWILESPSPEQALLEVLGGKALHRVLQFSGEDVVYRLCLSREAFAKAIDQFCNYGMIADSFPILHINTHGDAAGVSLTGGEVVTWDELRDMLQPLVRHRGGAMMLCMGSCQGINAREMAMNLDAGPAIGAIIGSRENVYTLDCAVAYMAFYRRFRRGANPEQCIAAMNAVYGSDVFEISEGRQMRAGLIAYLQAHAPELLERMRRTHQ